MIGEQNTYAVETDGILASDEVQLADKSDAEVTQEIGQIETERLVLRRLEEADVAPLQSIGNDDVFETVPEIETPFDAAAWVKHKLENECPTIGHVIITKAENIVVGYVQVTAIITQEGAHLSVGYWLGRTYWGKGYATEALTAALNKLEMTVDQGSKLIPVHAQVIPQNAASRRVLEKCSFVCSGPPNGAANTTDMVWYHWPNSAPRYHRPNPSTHSS